MMLLKKLPLVFSLLFLSVFCSGLSAQNDVERVITRDLVRPAYLKKGDTIMILAPAFCKIPRCLLRCSSIWVGRAGG